MLFRRFSNPQTLWLQSLAGGEPRLVTRSLSRDQASFSPDGQKVMYAQLEEVDGRLYPQRVVVPAAGGEPLARFLLPPGADRPRWTPDGQAVTYIDRDQGFNLMQQPIAGGQAMQLTRFEEGRVTGHEWSPDGRTIVLWRRVGQEESLWTLRPAGGKPERIAEFKTGRIGNVKWGLDSKRVFFNHGTSSQDVVLITDFR
jgi:Tol biopolymer transport system component